ASLAGASEAGASLAGASEAGASDSAAGAFVQEANTMAHMAMQSTIVRNFFIQLLLHVFYFMRQLHRKTIFVFKAKQST
ncbi:MAG TPA: hypothetical protein DEB31_08350, partial [Clostridiales bacterium]|nr:hypothetical protein [Clostridiales bacterium]